MRLKGIMVRASKRQYVLKDQMGEGGFSMIYETNSSEIICKVQVLSNSQIQTAYNKQKQMLQLLNHPNIVKLYDAIELNFKDQKYGLLFLQNCNSGTAFDTLEKSEGIHLNQKIIVNILLVVAGVLQFMHSKGIAHRDIKMQNVLANSKGELKLCDFGSCSRSIITKIDNSNRVQIQQYIEKTTTPFYRSPEQLDLYSGYEIGTKVDVFALGVFAFIMCFQKPPFESRLSAINKQYFIPETHPYSNELLDFIEKCFTTNPAHRPTAAEAKQKLKQIMQLKRVQIDLNYQQQMQITFADISRVTENNMHKTTAIAQTGLLDTIKRLYNQMTTETEGWIAGFVEDNEQAPLLKYNRSIISKCYEKRYKIQKVYEIVWKYSEQYKNKSLVTLKLLILLHNLLRKGPPQAITYDKDNSPIKLCVKLYKLWKMSMKPYDEEDVKRNTFLCLLIRSYCLILISKVRLCYQNSSLIEGNYSIVPYLSDIKNNTILKLNFISNMTSHLEKCLQFHEHLQRITYIPEIQKSIVLSLIDEQYCIVSTLTFLLSAFKIAVCYVKEEINLTELKTRVEEVQRQFEKVYSRLILSIDRSQKSSLFENPQIKLSPDVIKYIKNIKLQQKSGVFAITDHLNYKNSICGLKIPLTYQQVVKNPNFLKDLEKAEPSHTNVVQINQFKIKKDSLPKNQSSPNPQNNHRQSPKKDPPAQKKQLKQPKKQQPFQSPPTNPQPFSKPKDQKDKIFQNFTFQQNTQKKTADQKNRNMMQFTHQNLNKDFMSIDASIDKHDQFKDFFSIVEGKFEKEKERKVESQPQVNVLSNASSNSNISKEVFNSENKADINKIELMNFFFDQDEHEKKQVVQNQSPKMLKNQPKNSYLIDIGEEEQPPKQTKQKSPTKQQPLIPLDPFPTLQPPETPAQQKTLKQPPTPNDNNLIDLKQFVVQEVKKNAEQYLIDFSTLIFKQKIGYGNSSQVFKGEWRGRSVAIKKIKQNLNSQRSEKQFKRQIMTSVRIRHHPQLVTLIGVTQHEKYFYIINEYCNGSTLFDLLHQSNLKLPWSTRISIAQQIAKGMVFLHTNDPPIIHRDLKSLNVLLVNKYELNNSEQIQIKIADFGLSRDYASTYMTGTLGTYHWMAPQIFNNEPYTLKADVYSYGIVLWQIACRVPPYTNMKNPHSLMKFITMQNGRPDTNLIERDCPMQIRMLMMRCWDKFPSNRPNFTQILTCLQYLSQ